MSKHTLIIFLGIFIVVVALGGFPSWARTTLLVLSGIAVIVFAYLSSVVYCSNCKKLIDEADQVLLVSPASSEITSNPTQ
ncbi:hypothetical protein AUJ77_00235 [Candidatus Nomurabacteria bacterium CG1_02_43_90]|uniref:Uncharacterized protein n=1 Tax=Candidatus Nomurabacteria bacterium CG1_02_43_90 TaxID=1805281 RepID=A0A1J4V5E1_9BACT|nr:MAG: hypothetical protein AUJ77_00235 [Candidatus Nomurabacteria bacterium CG1_02_43_90]